MKRNAGAILVALGAILIWCRVFIEMQVDAGFLTYLFGCAFIGLGINFMMRSRRASNP